MDTISLYKHRIDSLMDILFGAGVSNPQTIIEQLNYLLFLRALSIKDDEAELLGITDESEKIFTGDLVLYRWQNLLALNAEDLFKTLEASFDVLQKKSKNSTVKLLFRNAHVKIFDKPTLRRVLHEIETFAKELDAIAHEGNKDVFGDMYEYLLSKLSSAGTNGQFRTPRHIIDFMVKVVDPKKNETILDPACGTAGFLVAAYRHIAGEYTSDKLKKAGSPRAMDKLSASENKFLFNHMFTGFDSDEDMIKFGMMNLQLHGLTKSRLARQNSLTDTTGMKDKFDVILANPPFSGKIDEESVSEDLRMGTKATELLFLRFMMDHLSPKGKLSVIVPEGVIFNASNAHMKIRRMLIEKGLWAVVSLPSGVFNPYAGVKTSLLFLDKEIAKTKDELLFIKVENDGFNLGAQRRPVEANDLPVAMEALRSWKNGERTENGLVFYIDKAKIANNKEFNLSVDRYRTSDERAVTICPMVQLKNVAGFIDDGDWIETKDQSDSGIRLIQTGNVGNGEYRDKAGKERYISDQTFKRLNCTEIFEGDVLLSRLPDPVGRACVLPKMSQRAITAVDCTIFRFNSSVAAKYFVYVTLSKEYQEKVDSLLSGATRQRISKGNLLEIEIPFPSPEIQKRIVAELDGYAGIIAGAKKVMENWTPKIDFDPSWAKVKLGDVCTFEYGEAMPAKKRKSGSYPVVGSNGVVGSHDEFIVKGPVIVVGRKGSAGEVNLIEQDCFPIDTTYYVKNKSEKLLNYKFLYFILLSADLQKMRGGGAVPGLNRNDAYDKEVFLPPIETQNQIVNQLEAESVSVQAAAKLIPIFEQKIKNRISKLWSE